jgi:hypothetical protein
MDWRTIKRVRMKLEHMGFFVEKIEDEYILCTNLDDDDEELYYIYPTEDSFIIRLYKIEQI